MKKKSLLLVTFLFILSINLHCQDFPDANVPDLFPLSPEIANLGKYGNVQHSLHTGNMNFSVPIYNIKAGEYSWPVSLQYNYGGLILEEKQSLNGLGWRLQASGSVTREVRGKPDEHKDGYYGLNNRGDRIKAYVDDNVNFTFDELKKFMTGDWDKEADI